MTIEISIENIIHFFDDKNLNKKIEAYLHFHKYRYQFLLTKIAKFQPIIAPNKPLKLLDIGPALQTALVRHFFPDFQVHTLGFQHPVNQLRANEIHTNFDLNQSDKNIPLKIPKYDIILFCEVIEHLYTKPEVVLTFLRQYLTDNGIIIIQTPNAVAIHKRVIMLLGYNPYQLLEVSKTGHFREYTVAELALIIKKSNLKLLEMTSKNYFNPNQTILQKMYKNLGSFMPASFRDAISLVAQKI